MVKPAKNNITLQGFNIVDLADMISELGEDKANPVLSMYLQDIYLTEECVVSFFSNTLVNYEYINYVDLLFEGRLIYVQQCLQQ